MSVCALASGRLYNGAPSPAPFPTHSRSRANELSSDCYAAAVNAMPSDLASVTDDYCQAMKASTMLASVCLQNGNVKGAVAHLGHYTSLSVMHGFHVEANWPADLTEMQRQERRRLVSTKSTSVPLRPHC